MSFDVAVLGAGHNGLVAALHLARAGRKVVVLEQRDEPGGLCAPREFHPGYTVPGLLHDTTGLRPALVDSLDLSFRDGDVGVLAPAEKGPGLLLHRDPQQAEAEIAGLSPADADAYRRWRVFLERVSGFVCSVL
ncbi:MAG: FAD-dependent oxidoreductase, partial [Planctomycetota bacterium]